MLLTVPAGWQSTLEALLYWTINTGIVNIDNIDNTCKLGQVVNGHQAAEVTRLKRQRLNQGDTQCYHAGSSPVA